MANRVLSIEIGQNMTHVIEVDYQARSPKIYNAFSFETPEDVMFDGKVKKSEVFLKRFQEGYKKHNIKTKKVIFAVISGKIANREVMIPLIKENKITNLLLMNSKEYFPVDLTQYQIVHRIVDKIDTKEQKQYKLNVWAVPNDLVESYEILAKYCGLILTALDYTGNSIVQMIQKNQLEEGTVFIKIDEHATMITILKKGKVDLQRNITYGINEAVETLIESGTFGEKLTYQEAIAVMKSTSCIRRHLDVEEEYQEEEDTELTIANTRIEITEVLRVLIGNIGRVLDYYISTNSDIDIKKIELIGIGADCLGLPKLMTNELGIKVSVFQKFKDVSLNKRIPEETFSSAEYAACIGAVIDPLKFSFGDKAVVPKPGTEAKESIALAGMVFTVCLLAAAGMTIFSVGHNLGLKAVNKALNVRINELQPAQQIYETYMSANQELTNSDQVEATTKTPNDNLLEFFDEMETGMPAGIVVQNLSANDEGVNMSVLAPSKEAAAKVLVQFRDFRSIASATTTGIRETTDETGVTKVTFTVICTFVSDASGAAIQTTTGEAVTMKE